MNQIENISGRQLEIIEAAGKILTASGVGGLTIKNLAKENIRLRVRFHSSR